MLIISQRARISLRNWQCSLSFLKEADSISSAGYSLETWFVSYCLLLKNTIAVGYQGVVNFRTVLKNLIFVICQNPQTKSETKDLSGISVCWYKLQLKNLLSISFAKMPTK